MRVVPGIGPHLLRLGTRRVLRPEVSRRTSMSLQRGSVRALDSRFQSENRVSLGLGESPSAFTEADRPGLAVSRSCVSVLTLIVLEYPPSVGVPGVRPAIDRVNLIGSVLRCSGGSHRGGCHALLLGHGPKGRRDPPHRRLMLQRRASHRPPTQVMPKSRFWSPPGPTFRGRSLSFGGR